MPLYEYYCEECDGIFETLRPMRESSWPVPCPVCNRDGQRIISDSFTAFTIREGLPRRIPDKGTYQYMGKQLKSPVSYPDSDPRLKDFHTLPPKTKTKGEVKEEQEKEVHKGKEKARRSDYRRLSEVGRKGEDKDYLTLSRDFDEGRKKTERPRRNF
ncbi:MAG: zinc ribbon domain-containing protein [Dehalococcoidia bacterium]